MKVLIAGGGTGGHVYPGIAVAEELQRLHPDAEVLFVGGRKGLESMAVPEAGFTIRRIATAGFPRRQYWRWPWALLVNMVGFVQALAIVLIERPGAVLGTGGYVSGPVALAARLLGRPLLLQEQNSVPGVTNRLLARIADEVHLSFLEARAYFTRRDHLKVTGNPVRMHIFEHDRDAAIREFALQPGKPTVFVFGGSGGARRINDATIDALRRLKGRLDLQVILQTGREDFERARKQVEDEQLPATVMSFLTRIHQAYGVADLIVGRAGAMTLAEIAVCGRPSILVPYPHAAHNHQERNASSLVDRGAAVMIRDEELTGERLAKEIAHLLADRSALSRMSANARLFARPDAATRIARSLARWAEGHGREPEEATAGGGR